ncbi:uncharacterized protein LOC144039087 [Vanacampus margaritifer]
MPPIRTLDVERHYLCESQKISFHRDRHGADGKRRHRFATVICATTWRSLTERPTLGHARPSLACGLQSNLSARHCDCNVSSSSSCSSLEASARVRACVRASTCKMV